MDKIVSVNAVRALYFSSQLSQFHVHRFGRHLNTLLHSQRRTFRILNMTGWLSNLVRISLFVNRFNPSVV